MKNILLIGVGGTGSKAVDIFFQKCNELGNQTGNNVTALVFDTDAGDLKRITAAKTVVMADNASVGTICDRLGTEYLREWFPCDDKAIRAQEMVRGASQWRKKSYLAFLNLMNKPLARSTFISALEEMTVDPGASCEIYIIASIAGGTGSGSFIPIALYAKRYLRKNLGKDPIVNAMIALPDIYADSQTAENKIKVYANAYAILRELNAINLVARNYNAGVALHKKAPIRFKIGDEKEPTVGVLFNASDKQFWTPEAAPFSQIFLLDRIPGINSVTAHDMVLANSLYTMICTEIGSAFESEFSNHELLRSQNNGSNAIYAGVSTSQIRFPRDSVLNYLAHKKTVDSCDSEWITLHRATENNIREKEQQAKAMKRRYTMKDGEYAKLVVEEAERLAESGNDEFLSIMERGVYGYDDEGKVVKGEVVQKFIKSIDSFIGSKIENEEATRKEIGDKAESCLDEGKVNKEAIPTFAADAHYALLRYYTNCIDSIRSTSSNTADAILCLDKKKESFTGKDLSIIERIIKKNGQYIHPVAAMVQLCNLRIEISKKLDANKFAEWPDLRRRTISAIPDEFLMLNDEQNTVVDKDLVGYVKGVSKSSYFKLGKERFRDGVNYDFEGDMKRSNGKADFGFMWNDALYALSKIYRGAQGQLRRRVYMTIAADLDILIAKYRNFFNRFDKEKEDLIEQTKTALRRDAGNVDSVINVYSSKEDKNAIYKMIVEEGGPITDAEIAKTDNIVGSGVFKTVYNSAAAEYAQDGSWNDKDSSAFRSLFGDMIDAYRVSIGTSEAFEKLASCNVIEAMVAACGEDASDKAQDEAFKSRFSIAQDLATPSLRIDNNGDANGLVVPSEIMVFMMSIGTGKYIKKNAEELGLQLPADQNKEFDVIKACAEQFIRKYSGNNKARVSIVSNMPDQVLYCTGEIMDITPLRIAKFNELGEDNVYFRNYSTAINNYKTYGTDMWNPHLGNNLHKRGYLPYMNEEMEKACDIKVVKALLYAFQKERLVYKDSNCDGKLTYSFTFDGRKIVDCEGKPVSNKNIAQLMDWLRNEEDIVEECSAAFDVDIQSQMGKLPSLASDNASEIGNLEAAITDTPFMRMLTDKLYVDTSTKGTKAASKVKLDAKKPSIVERKGPTAIEFAYMIKTSEEVGRDCDDAERILDVLYNIFVDMCAYRANIDNTPERFIQVYKQQLGNMYEALASAAVVFRAGSECKSHFNQLTTWLHQSKVFDTISDDNPWDAKGKVAIGLAFDYNKAVDVKRVLDFISKGAKNLVEAEPVVIEDSVETVES